MRIRIFGQYLNTALLMLAAVELLLMLAAFYLTYHFDVLYVTGFQAWTRALRFAVCGFVGLSAMGLYSPRQRNRLPSIMLRVLAGLGFGTLAAFVLEKLADVPTLAAKNLLAVALLSWLLLMLLRAATRRLWDEQLFKKRVLVLGAGESAQRLLLLRRRADRRGFEIVGYVPAGGGHPTVPPGKLLTVETTLLALAERLHVDEIVTALDERRQRFPAQSLLECRTSGIEVTELLSFLERETGKLHVELLSASWLIFADGFRHDAFRRVSERAFDVVVSLALLVVCAPLMLLVALAIKLEEGWAASVFYRQQRVGYCGRIFEIVKFRSMRMDAEATGKAVWAQAGDARVTRVGAVIRKLRIDELPQLLAVLRGKMSFVGPRPERPEFVEQLAERIPYFRERHLVKPGITGWAQVCYPYGASEHDALEKLQYDLYYVKNHGLMFDILILLQTVEVILFGKGAR